MTNRPKTVGYVVTSAELPLEIDANTGILWDSRAATMFKSRQQAVRATKRTIAHRESLKIRLHPPYRIHRVTQPAEDQVRKEWCDVNLPTVEELDAWESLPKLYDGTARIPSDGDRERFSETAYHLWPRLIRAARLAVEGQERAKIVIDAVRKERDWFDRRHRLARGTYGYNGEYERKSSALTHTLGMIDQALAHLDEKPEPTESEAGK